MKRFIRVSSSFYLLIVLFTHLILLLSQGVLAKDLRIVKPKDGAITKIVLSPGRTTILNFSSKPGKVLIGNQGSFSIQYVENDIAIAPITAASHSNLFVYMRGKRFSFDLVTANQSFSDTLVQIQDQDSEKVRVKIHE
ncbi:MAG: hypothetical protein KA715_00220 [Xanthomonadaceae bacterium]|nr:hypothetical protein [Xanthomonadaceae bacterium]